jgi:protein-disulfide isomerase
LRQVEETYAGSGLVRFEYKHFAFLGPESIRAAEASECALEQGQFWPYHDTLFLNQRGENAGAFGDDALNAFAAALGLDAVAFEACLDSGRYADQINAERATAAERGVGTTPSTVINGQLIEGAIGIERLQSIIDSELARLSG